ncbi:hypothetical protein [Phaeobacter sp. J2-8]|uniref:hypothetical protein n=1 Tax=Phaeobacter sp. J2-8 TaxID=2931394 RepID=UPI001FD6154C|nr:hypothetical protein [Phaeobacter sp. J2-8]MCJ7873960.1 hypothetical protein [Phaeobacter sp. J2-8]
MADEFQTDAFLEESEKAPLMNGLVCIFLIGFSAFGYFVATGVGYVTAYFLASAISAVGPFVPIALLYLRRQCRPLLQLIPQSQPARSQINHSRMGTLR